MVTTVPPSRAFAPGAAAPVRHLPPVRAAGPAAAVALVAATATAPAAVAAAAVPLALLGIVVGIPHGAADHLVPFWAARRRVTLPALGAVLAGYLAVAAVAFAAVLVAPTVALWAFLVASAYHFGRGEAVASAGLGGRPVPGPRADLLLVAAHGAVVVGLPLAAWREGSLPLLDLLAPGVAATPPALLDAVLVGAYALAVAAVAALLRARRPADAAELGLLALLFTTVPAPAAFGVYFALWHAARHTDRLVRLPGPDGVVDVRRGTLRYLRAAALPTAGAVALLAVLAGTASPTVLTAAIVTLVGLTAPHLVVVEALDRHVRRTGRSAVPRGTLTRSPE